MHYLSNKNLKSSLILVAQHVLKHSKVKHSVEENKDIVFLKQFMIKNILLARKEENLC